MKKRGITFVEMLVILAIIGTLIGLLAPGVQMAIAAHKRGAQAGEPAAVPAQIVAPAPQAGSWYLFTVAHDGHWFVISRTTDGSRPFMHHPSCPCTKKPEAEATP